MSLFYLLDFLLFMINIHLLNDNYFKNFNDTLLKQFIRLMLFHPNYLFNSYLNLTISISESLSLLSFRCYRCYFYLNS